MALLNVHTGFTEGLMQRAPGCGPAPCCRPIRNRVQPLPMCRSMAASRIVCRAAATPSSSAIEAVDSLAGPVEDAIREAVGNCLLDTDLGVGTKKKGKVRDTYDLGDRVLIVTTDRQSAFDRVLAAVPFKGQVLNQTSAWWMDATSHIVGNALLGLPDPNVALMKKCQVFPVEFVVRGFMTGSTDTSLWTHYNAGSRSYCGHAFPDGLVKNQRLACNVVTPTTKAESGDVPISAQQIVEQGLMSKSDFDQVAEAALALFNFGQQQAESRGLLLVDTKYEFGKDAEGNILLVDEIHTPDSSRYWIESTFQQRLADGLEPQNIDKEFLRLWFRQHCDPYKDEVLPEAPTDLVVELSRRYVYLYQKITGQTFVPEVLAGVSPAERIKRNVQQQLL